MSYNFIHLIVQELLAAFHIARLPHSEQVSKFKKLFKIPRFSVICQLYAAITKLSTPGISDIITKEAKKYANCIGFHFPNKYQGRLLSLLHCLYEAQVQSLCHLVAQHLLNELRLSSTTLTPLQCYYVSYFISCICVNKTTTTGEFRVGLTSCSIGDRECNSLVSGLHKCLAPHNAVATTLSMNLSYNDIRVQGTSDLCTLLQTGCISTLKLSGNKGMSDQGTSKISRELESNTSLRELHLYGCGITARGAAYIAKAITTNSSLTVLDISNNALCDEGIHHISDALKDNRSLQVLHLRSCGMKDEGVKHLANSLQHNQSLTSLRINNHGGRMSIGKTTYGNESYLDYPNVISYSGIAVLTECLKHSTLTELVLPKDFETTAKQKIHKARKRSGLSPIDIKINGKSIFPFCS